MRKQGWCLSRASALIRRKISFPAIPGRREAANPESILRSAGVTDSGLAVFGRTPE